MPHGLGDASPMLAVDRSAAISGAMESRSRDISVGTAFRCGAAETERLR